MYSTNISHNAAVRWRFMNATARCVLRRCGKRSCEFVAHNRNEAMDHLRSAHAYYVWIHFEDKDVELEWEKKEIWSLYNLCSLYNLHFYIIILHGSYVILTVVFRLYEYTLRTYGSYFYSNTTLILFLWFRLTNLICCEMLDKNSAI